jgi:hypothetical protein
MLSTYEGIFVNGTLHGARAQKSVTTLVVRMGNRAYTRNLCSDEEGFAVVQGEEGVLRGRLLGV